MMEAMIKIKEPPVDGEVGIPEDVTTYEITDGTQEVFGGHTFAAFTVGDEIGINFDDLENGTSASINLTIDGTDAGLIVLTGKRPPLSMQTYILRGEPMCILEVLEDPLTGMMNGLLNWRH